MSTTKLQEQIERATNRLAQLKAREIVKARQAEARQRQTARRADAHRKILLGGLVIAADVDHWDEATICGALLHSAGYASTHPDILTRWKDQGIAHLEARKASREGR